MNECYLKRFCHFVVCFDSDTVIIFLQSLRSLFAVTLPHWPGSLSCSVEREGDNVIDEHHSLYQHQHSVTKHPHPDDTKLFHPKDEETISLCFVTLSQLELIKSCGSWQGKLGKVCENALSLRISLSSLLSSCSQIWEVRYSQGDRCTAKLTQSKLAWRVELSADTPTHFAWTQPGFTSNCPHSSLHFTTVATDFG